MCVFDCYCFHGFYRKICPGNGLTCPSHLKVVISCLLGFLRALKTSLIQGTFGGGLHGCQKFRKSSHGHSERDMAPTLSGIHNYTSLFGHSNQRGLQICTLGPWGGLSDMLTDVNKGGERSQDHVNVSKGTMRKETYNSNLWPKFAFIGAYLIYIHTG